MNVRPEPTETYDGRITVAVLRDEGDSLRIRRSSYPDAIETVREHRSAAAAVKIVDADGEVVFSTETMDIDEWAVVWRREKRRAAGDVPDHDCPYDEIACVSDDLCVRCSIDKERERLR